ncbi:MAG: arginine--tRNA ligase, partial [Ruminococcus sp.]|nr:arginine--tRNA ligase [Ruminococcus sp.]
MSDLINSASLRLREIIMDALGVLVSEEAIPAVPLPGFNIEIPADKSHGDFAANTAMVCAKALRMPPRKIAELICEKLSLEGTIFEKAEVAGPGFLNFFLGRSWFSDVVRNVLEEGGDYGKTELGKGKKVLVEFVSANPTGPMHIGNARGGAIGDCLASVLQWAGYHAEREFYVNDAGNQIEKFGKSLRLRYMQICGDKGQEIVAKNLDMDTFCKTIYEDTETFPMPDDVYLGMDIIAHAKNFFDEYGMIASAQPEEECKKALVDYALPKNIDGLHKDLAKYRINYDTWFRESTLHNDGSVQEVIEKLKAGGYTYEQDGALWFRTTDFGDEKDRVLVRDNGIPTYFVPDIAYHYNKLA